MAYYAISYDLIEGKDYEKITKELERQKAEKAQLSFWLIETSSTLGTVRDHFAKFVDDDDRLMVIEFVAKPRYTRALPAGKKWIDDRFA